MADEGFTAEELVQACNKIIVYAGLIAKVANVQEVRAVCSSSPLLVAALEGFLGRRLEDVIRSPSTPDERAFNFTLVVDVLSQILNCDLSHISGQRIVEGSVEDISNILELLAALCHGKPLLGPAPAHPTEHSPPAPLQVEPHGPSAYTLAPEDSQDPVPGSPVVQPQGRPGLAQQHSQATAAGSPPRASTSTDAEGSAYDSDGPGRRNQLRYLTDEQRTHSSDEEVGRRLQFWQRQQQQQRGPDHEAAGPSHGADAEMEAQEELQLQWQLRRGGQEDRYAQPDTGRSSLPPGAVRVRRRVSGRRQRGSLLQRVVLGGAQLPLSPIQEVSREGGDLSRASKETPGVQSTGRRTGDSASSGSPGRPQQPHVVAQTRPSAGGVSSVISVPSVPYINSRVGSRLGSSSGAGNAQHPQQSSDSGSPGAEARPWTADAAVQAPPPPPSSGTSTLLERALSQAEAALRGLGREYEAFYYRDDDNDDAAGLTGRSRRRARKQQRSRRGDSADEPTTAAAAATRGGGGIVRAGGPQEYAPARRALRAAPWPDGSTGQVKQHQAFLRRAKRVLTASRGTTGANLTAESGSTATASLAPSATTGPLSRTVSRAGSGAGSGGFRRSSRPAKPPPHAASVAEPAVGRRAPPQRRRWSSEAAAAGPSGGGSSDRGGGSSSRSTGGHEELVRTLRGGVAPLDAAAAMSQGSRRLLQRIPNHLYGPATAGGMALMEDSLVGGLEKAGRRTLPPGLQLNPDLQGRLRSLARLAEEDPKQRAARAAVESLTVADDLLRHARRRAMIERLNRARTRREAALRVTTDRLHEQAQEYERRVEQLRLQRLAEEWTASQRSAQMQRALAAELAVRDAFLEVLEGEKEVLLVERQEARADERAAFPSYKRAMRKAEKEYVEVFKLLEDMLAVERQQRVRADREAVDAQRYYNQLTAQVVYDRVQELLYRVARDDEATMQRRSIAAQPKARRALMAQIRRLLEMP